MRSRTRRLAGFVLAGAKDAGAEVEIIELADMQITPCTACESCSLDGRCVFADDFPAAYDRMQDADGLVFASPVYVDNVSGQMKVFIDRLADAMHYQNFSGRYGCSIATTEISGGDAVVGYLNLALNYLGVTTVGGMSVALGDDPEAIDRAESAERDLGRRWSWQSKVARVTLIRRQGWRKTGGALAGWCGQTATGGRTSTSGGCGRAGSERSENRQLDLNDCRFQT